MDDLQQQQQQPESSEALESMGFIIRCMDGIDVIVSSDQAKTIFEANDYFRNVFRHGTTECYHQKGDTSKSRVLTKPNWTAFVASSIIELLTTNSLQNNHRCCTVEVACAVHCAAQEILLDVIPSLIANNPLALKDRVVLDWDWLYRMYEAMVDSSTTHDDTLSKCCSITVENCDATMHMWDGLIKQDIYPSVESEFIALKAKTTASSSGGQLSRELFNLLSISDERNVVPTFDLVSAKSSISKGSIVHEVLRLMNAGILSEFGSFTGYSLRVPLELYLVSTSHLIKELVKSSGAKIYIHQGSSLGYYLDGSNSGVTLTITGSPQQIKNALSKIAGLLYRTVSSSQGERKQKRRCSLRIGSPSIEQLNQVIRAVDKCKHNPGTIGFDARTCCIYAVKTSEDMEIVLNELCMFNKMLSKPKQKGDEEVETSRSLRLVQLTYPKGVF